MVDYKSKGYTNEEIENILAEFKKSGDGITVFCKKRDHKPSYQTLKGWLDIADGGTSGAMSSTGLSLAKEFEVQFEADKKAAYVTFLKDKAKALETQLSLVNAEITKLTTEPSIAE